jgi:sugar phosphate isomerase/epimerase
MHLINRRQLALAGIGLAALGGTSTANETKRKFTMDFCPGRIGVNGGQKETIEFASQYGFESVEPFGTGLAKLTDGENAELLELLASKKLVWGAAGLDVEFRKNNDQYQADLQQLPNIARALKRAGVTRVGTWLGPSHSTLTYRANFDQHAKRLRAVANILNEHGLSLGLEYVGPRTLWTSNRYAFIHTMAETKELLQEIGTKNVGLVLDSWHWYTAEEKVEDLLTLSASSIIAVDLNDAPKGIEVSKQIDNQRELPSATGVIDLKSFLNALVQIGYDGPIRAEPFNAALNALDDAPAVQKTAEAMKKAFSLT